MQKVMLSGFMRLHTEKGGICAHCDLNHGEQRLKDEGTEGLVRQGLGTGDQGLGFTLCRVGGICGVGDGPSRLRRCHFASPLQGLVHGLSSGAKGHVFLRKTTEFEA